MKKNTTRKKIILGVFFILLCLSLSGIIISLNKKISSLVKSVGGSYSEIMVGSPRFINPVLGQSQTDKDLMKLIYDQLLRVENGEVKFSALSDLELSDDKKTYTLKLRDDLYFSDGNKLDVDDVIFTINSIQNPLIKSPYAENWLGTTLKKIDSTSFSIHLEKPYVDFVYNLELSILPEHIWENVEADEFSFYKANTLAIGSGPYKINNFIYNKESGIPSELNLSNNDRYSKKLYIEKLNFIFVENEDLKSELLRKNTSYSAANISSASRSEILSNTDSKIIEYPTSKVVSLFFNTRSQGITKDKKIRSILESMIDTEKLQKDLSLRAKPESTDAAGKNSETNATEKNHRDELKKLGWEIGDNFYEKKTKDKVEILEFSISTLNIKEFQTLAKYLQAEFEKQGVKVNILSYDSGDFQQEILRPRSFEALLFGYDIEKPSDLYAFWHSSQSSDPGLNVSQLKSSKLDLLLEKLRTENNPTKVDEIAQIISSESAAIFLYKPSIVFSKTSSLKGLDGNSKHRFNNIHTWYKETRRIWNIFIQD